MNFRFPSFSRVAPSAHLDTLVLVFLVTAVWIFTHRYHGIWHDGVMYAGQAIFRLNPDSFATDLFFAYGSQDAFTAFTGIYALGIEKLGLPVAAAFLLGIAHVAWVAAAAFLLRGILSGLQFWLALMLITVLPATYGSLGLFSYGETFLTARVWAEPAALLAVACVLRGYRVTAIASLMFAAAMHPVIGFPAALLVFFFGFQGRQKLLGIVLGLAGLLVLNVAGVRPFADLTKSMDSEWLRLAMARSPFVFLDHWAAGEYREPVFFALLLTTAALVSARENGRLWWCALGVFLVGMGLALLVLYWPGVLLVQLQTWRVLWLTKILAVAAGMALLHDTWTASPYARLLVGALAACTLTLDGTGLACAVLLSALIVVRHRFFLEPHLPLWLLRLAWAAIILVIGESIFWAASPSFFALDFSDPSLSGLSLPSRLLIIAKDTAWFVFPALVAGIWYLLQRRPGSRAWLLLLSTLVFLFAAGHWQRSSGNRAAENYLPETIRAELTEIIGPRDLTYWGDGQRKLWLILHRGSYASALQAAGIIFSRQTAIEAERRLARVRPLGLSDSIFDRVPKEDEKSSRNVATIDGLVHACHDPILDFVVLSQAVAGTTPMKTVRLSPLEGEYHIYACAPLRAFPDPFAD